MPVLTITMRRGRTPEQKQRLVAAACTALQESFALKDSSYSVRVLELAPEDFYLPSPKTERYVLVEVDCFAGREQHLKDGFSATLLQRLAEAGEDPSQVLSLIRESPMGNWGYQGKKNPLPHGLEHCYHTKNLQD